MKAKVFCILIIIMLALSGCGEQPINEISAEPTPTPVLTAEPTLTPTAEPTPTPLFDSDYERAAKRDLLALMCAYPDDISGIRIDSDGLIYLVMSSGAEILYDDMQEKSFEEKLNSADIQDTMELVYPLEDIELLYENDFDPGRIRCYALLEEIYGSSKDAVVANLVDVAAGEVTVRFNSGAGAAQSLTAVFVQITDIINTDSSIGKFVYPMSGTFNYRVIAGTERLSPHAFAAAIDLFNDSTDYWREATREEGQKRLDDFPRQIAKAFEENGFIWGGKWAHFDILHFEYRPELILKAKYYTEQTGGKPWQTGFPETNEVMELVRVIDEVFGGSSS